jgi:hypothetical protein
VAIYDESLHSRQPCCPGLKFTTGIKLHDSHCAGRDWKRSKVAKEKIAVVSNCRWHYVTLTRGDIDHPGGLMIE